MPHDCCARQACSAQLLAPAHQARTCRNSSTTRSPAMRSDWSMALFLVSVNRVANRPSWMDLLLVPRSSPASPSGLRAACTGRPAHVCTHQGAHAHIKDVRPTDVTVNKLDSSSLTLLACCSGPGCRCCLSSDSLMRPSTTLQHWKSCRRAGTAAHTAAWSAQDMRASQ